MYAYTIQIETRPGMNTTRYEYIHMRKLDVSSAGDFMRNICGECNNKYVFMCYVIIDTCVACMSMKVNTANYINFLHDDYSCET